jgi:hypothetical protein
MYLQIRNPGTADITSFTLVGASGTRGYGNGTIGQFGSGSKFSIALLLRRGIRPIVVAGTLKCEFFSKPIIHDGKSMNQVCIKFSGKDIHGNTNNKTQDLGYVMEMGEMAWDSTDMAIREFYSNAIDGAIKTGGSYTDVQTDIVNEPRAKANFTTVYIPYTVEIEKSFSQLDSMFLHISRPGYLEKRLLPKSNPDVTRFYRNGVRVLEIPEKSIYDYNLSDSLPIDESRNVNEYTAKGYAALALQKATVSELVPVMESVVRGEDTLESKFDTHYLTHNHTKFQKVFSEVWERCYGKNAVLTQGIATVDSFIIQKGMKPIAVKGNWRDVLKTYGIKTENDVLTSDETAGRVISPATAEQIEAVKWAWQVFGAFGMLCGKPFPEIRSFQQVMDGGSQTYGIYKEGIVYLHTELGGKVLKKVALEELTHHLTGAGDGSRDLQDILFRLITEMAA